MGAFWGIVASNAVVATILAMGVMLLGRVWKNAPAVHALWVVVLLKLFTPPLVTAELPSSFRVVPPEARADRPNPAASVLVRDELPSNASVVQTPTGGAVAARITRRAVETRSTGTAGLEAWSYSAVLAAIWIGGACCSGLVHAVRLRGFATIIRESDAAPAVLRMMVTDLASRLRLKRVPDVRMTSRALPPLVWSFGLFPRMILPAELFARLGRDAQRTIVAHELVHLRRGDDVVRLIELAAKTVFWWHPVVWWASRQLRELEEQCCDGRVLELVPDQPRTYAAALVETLEFLSEQPWQLVPLRTAIDPVGSLSRRIFMLTQRRPNRLSRRSAALVAGLVALPLAVAFAVDDQPERKGQPPAGAPAAVLHGRVTDEAGLPLPGVHVRVATPAIDMRFVDVPPLDGMSVKDYKNRTVRETRSDAAGDYRLELPGITARTQVSIDASKAGYRRLVGTLMSGGDPKDIDVAPATDVEASLVLKPALHFAGIVLDERGNPIPEVEVSANILTPNGGSGGVERTVSDANGRFELFNYPSKQGRFAAFGAGPVWFSHPDYIESSIKDVYALTENQRESVGVILDFGRRLTGTVFDAAGKPVPRVMVEAVRKGSQRKATMTDANGKFAFRGLSGGPTTVTAFALELRQKAQLPIDLNDDKLNFEVQLQPVVLPANPKSSTVLGMRLTDVTPELKSAYDLWNDDGALILDPGNDSDRLKVGKLVEGYVFWMVGQNRVGSVREFVDQLLAETTDPNAEPHSVRVVYSFKTVQATGTNTQYLKLTRYDRKALEILSKKLTADPK